jgi:type II secretion system protein D
MNFGFGHLGHRAKSMTHSASLATPGRFKWLILCSMILALCFMLFSVGLVSAQRQEGGLGDKEVKVTERDEEGKAKKLSFFNVINANIHDILKFMSDETDLTIIASDKVQGKVSLVNLKDITVEEAMEALKTALNTLGFTTIRVNRTIVIIPLDEAKTKPVRVQVGSDPEQIESIDEMITQIMPLKYADAAEMVQNLKNLIPKSGDMFADTTNNALIITDSSSNIRRIALILQELDSTPEGLLRTRVFQLKYADASSLQQTLERLFGQGVEMARGLQKMSSRGADEIMKRMNEAREQGRIPGRGIDFVKGLVIISADERTNKLIITASEENLEIIAQMIEQLDTSDVAQAEIKVFLLDYAVAEDVATALEDLLQGTESRRLPPWERWRAREWGGGAKGIQGEVNIVSDDRMNAVIVSSDPQNFPLIEEIINQLDQQVAPQEVMKIFPLKYADAETVVENLQDLFQGSSDRDMPWWERDRRRRERRDRGQGEEVTGIQGTVNLIADVRLNSVIVSTAAANIPVIEDLIKKLDITVPDLESATRIFPLQNADAENLADILGSMFQGGQSRDRFFWLPRSSRQQTRGATVTGSIDISAYPRTNSLVVSTSSARNFEIIEGLIKDLDQETPSDFKQKTLIYPLEYSDADEMSSLLNDIFSEGGGYSRQRQQRDRSFFRMMMGQSTTMLKDMSTLAGQVQVNADAQTNTLIITTPERNFEAIKEIIGQLDIVRGQVWLQIMVVEVTLSDDTKLGLEWSWQEGKHFGKKDLTGQFGTDFQLDQEGIGFTYKVFNKNLTALLHTLMRENEVTVLSTPSLLTRDNQTAEWRVGKDIPYLESTRTDNFGNIMYDYNFLQDIGINIRITPHIAKAGNIERLKAGEKRTVGLDIETVNVSNFIEYTDFNAPVTSDSTVTTYVDVEDGEQIVIGGMIRSEEKNTTHQIPILGSIPFLGRLFKKTEKVQENTEILLLITPRIIDINREEDREVLKQLQSERLSEKDRELIENNHNMKIEKPPADKQ